MKYPKKLMWIATTEADKDQKYIEIFNEEDSCANMLGGRPCGIKGAYRNNQEYDVAMCYSCITDQDNIDELTCCGCHELIKSDYDSGAVLENCKCLNKNSKKKVVIKEKPIPESQWIRVRDYA